jgi:hypothetical protein
VRHRHVVALVPELGRIGGPKVDPGELDHRHDRHVAAAREHESEGDKSQEGRQTDHGITKPTFTYSSLFKRHDIDRLN